MPLTKIAVIGSGIAGLTAAHFLSQQPHVHVTVLERDKNAGMDAHRLDLEHLDVSIDLPTRMFNSSQWPELCRLYDVLGVPTKAVSATQSFSRLVQPDQVRSSENVLRLNSAMSPKSAIGNLFRTDSRKILADARRLLREGTRDLEIGMGNIALGDYLRDRGYSDVFKNVFLYATLSSTVCTCSYESLDRYPAWIVLNALRRIVDGGQLFRAANGTRDVVRRLTSRLPRVQTSAHVEQVSHDENWARVNFADGSTEDFDHVVMATQANTALQLLPPSMDSETATLSQFKYDDLWVTIHDRPEWISGNSSDRFTFNMLATHPKGSLCSVWLQGFYGEPSVPVDLFQTISQTALRLDNVYRQVKLQRAIVDAGSLLAIDRLEQLHAQPNRRIWFCGSWASKGIPLLETGVVSAKSVANLISKSLAQSADAPALERK